MDQETKDLITEAEKFIDRLTIKNHIVYQVRTHIDRLQRTGTGKEVVEHFVAYSREHRTKSTYLIKLRKVFYFNNMIIDSNLFKYEYWNKANRQHRWNKVKKITYNSKPKCRDKRPNLDK
jgi:hypothetical protein